MTLYVDDCRAPFGRMITSHMMADTSEQLLNAADALGLKREWLQRAGSEYYTLMYQIANAARLFARHGRSTTCSLLIRQVVCRNRNNEHRRHPSYRCPNALVGPIAALMPMEYGQPRRLLQHRRHPRRRLHFLSQ